MSAIPERLTAALADRYLIERELGAGGMATVYLAHDIKHDRKVAVKVLKPELAAVLGAERFVVEIKTTASLSHPHILPLFDSGTADGFLFYVMPFIEGETLRDKLNRETQLGVDESVRIACEVADALGYAHRHGVIHRDIKPENILMHDGRPMVADFGIALALSAAAGGRMTETGLSLGTPHYMSPEQATAEKEITGRSDIYSLASVLYEMLAGNPPHVGASAQQIIMKIIAEPVEAVTKFRKSVPPNVAAATAKALEKLPADRFENASAFVLALRDPTFAGAGTGASSAGGALGIATSGGRRAFAGVAGVAVLAVLVAFWALLRPQADVLTSRFVVTLRPDEALAYIGSFEPPRLALTPDGRELVYVADSAYARRVLRLRRLGDLESVTIPGTEEAQSPVISWDGEQVAFVALKSLASAKPVIRVASLRGGTTLTVVDSGSVSSPAWGPGGFVYFIGTGDVIRRVSASGGPIEDVVRLPALSAGSQYAPWLRILPGGRGALVGEAPRASMDRSSGVVVGNVIRAIDLRSGRAGASLPGTAGEYVAEAGALIHITADEQLMATRFDEGTLETRGRTLVLFGKVDNRTPRPDLAVGGGNLVYTTPGSNAAEQVVWARRGSDSQELVDSTWKDSEFESFSLSPDGRRLAITIRADDTRLDVWLKPIDRTGALSRLTFGGSDNKSPSWIGDGSFVSYLSQRDGRPEVWRRRADGTGSEERVVRSSSRILDAVWTRDGTWLLATVEGPSSLDIVAMHVGSDSALQPLLSDAFLEASPAISPDGRWLAYVSTESGAPEIYVRPFPRVQDGKWLISNTGGIEPVWSRDGRELFYRSVDGNAAFAVDMTRGPSAVIPRAVLSTRADRVLETNDVDRMFDVSPDGRRFLVVRQGKGDVSGDLVVVLNFAAELRAALKSGKR